MPIEVDADGYWKVSKMFPCDCGGEALSVVVREDIYLEDGSLEVDIAFFKHEHKYTKRGKMSWMTWFRCMRAAWKGEPWMDMVTLRENVAVEFAHHILFHVEQNARGRGWHPEPEKG